MTNTERLIFSVPEVKAATGFSDTTVWRLIKDGTFPSVQIGRRTMIKARPFLDLCEGNQ